jgi:hypothetical protein
MHKDIEMDSFSATQFFVQSKRYVVGACVLYPKGHPSEVCVEVATPGKLIGRVTYALRRSASAEFVRRSAIEAFLYGSLREKLVLEGGDVDGGPLEI